MHLNLNIAPRTMLSALAAFAGPMVFSGAAAETLTLNDYLASMDRTEVVFSGKLGYNTREDSFIFYTVEGDFFRVVMDAGRDARERVQKECAQSSLMFSSSDNRCNVDGRGTVEIQGSSILLSIDEVVSLEK
jgi:hypothetical protein